MNLSQLVAELNRRRIRVGVERGRLVVPDSQLRAVADLRPHIGQHREALKELVPFQRGGEIRRIRSVAIGEDFWLAADNADFQPDDPARPNVWRGLVVYRVSDAELIHHTLDRSQPEKARREWLQLLHGIMREFGGTAVRAHLRDTGEMRRVDVFHPLLEAK